MVKIRTLLAELPSEWGVSNFRQSSYFNVQGKEQPCYEMTKDGFIGLSAENGQLESDLIGRKSTGIGIFVV